MDKIIIKGRVQGVSFRYYAKMKADELHIKGNIRNLDDGSVLILAAFTSSEQKDSFLRWCQMGSPASRVDEITVSHHDFSEEETPSAGFQIIR